MVRACANMIMLEPHACIMCEYNKCVAKLVISAGFLFL